MAVAKEREPFRTLDEGEDEILRQYAAACDMEKTAAEVKKQLRDQVDAILVREDCEKELYGRGFTFSVQYRSIYDPKCEEDEREIDVNGQMIVASVKQLKDASTRLSKVVKSKERIIGHSMAVSATAL